MAKTKIEKLRDQIKEDLLNQLKRNGIEESYYSDLVSDYIKMWDTKNALIKDIKTRGVQVECHSSFGTNIKKNESVDQMIKINAQMLKLLDSMGIKPVATEQGGGDIDL